MLTFLLGVYLMISVMVKIDVTIVHEISFSLFDPDVLKN